MSHDQNAAGHGGGMLASGYLPSNTESWQFHSARASQQFNSDTFQQLHQQPQPAPPPLSQQQQWQPQQQQQSQQWQHQDPAPTGGRTYKSASQRSINNQSGDYYPMGMQSYPGSGHPQQQPSYPNQTHLGQQYHYYQHHGGSSTLSVQPRRASDEVMGSTSRKMLNRVSPDQSRRSISAIDVGESRPISVGANLKCAQGRITFSGGSPIKLPQKQAQQQQQQQQQQQVQQQQQPHQQQQQLQQQQQQHLHQQLSMERADTMTPSQSGEHLVGPAVEPQQQQQPAGPLQQQLSQSRAECWPESQPMVPSYNVIKSSPRNSLTGTGQPLLPGSGHKLAGPGELATGESTPATSRGVALNGASKMDRRGSGPGLAEVRRDSGGVSPPRKSSFAMQTVRRLKRTISLNKGNDMPGDGPQGAGQADGGLPDSRRSSNSTTTSSSEAPIDVAIVDRLSQQQEYVGEIKLSFIMTKGQLEIDVICARDLKGVAGAQGQPPDSYVKTYLKSRTRHYKKKTRVVPQCNDPQYKQIIKYDGSIIYDRTLLVSVWQKQKGFDHNLPIGGVEIQINQLSLDKLTLGWYKLRPMHLLVGSRDDDDDN